MTPSANWTVCPKARQKGVYWRQRSSRIEYGFLQPLGNVVRTGFDLQDAKDARNKALLDQAAGKEPPNRSLTVSDLISEVREQKRSYLRPSSMDALERGLSRIDKEIGHMRPRAVTPRKMQQWIVQMQAEPLDGDTILRYLQPMGDIYRLAIRYGAADHNPMSLLSRGERPKQTRKEHYEWAPEDVEALLRASEEFDKREYAQKSYAPLIYVLVFTGMRISEAQGLRWDDVDLLGSTITVRGSWGRKGGLQETKTKAGIRKIPMPERLVEVLLKHKPIEAKDSDWVFPSLSGERPIDYNAFRIGAFIPIVELAGLEGKGVTPHELRHCLASMLIAGGISDVDVASVMGHSSPNVTRMLYAHVFDRVDASERIRGVLDGLGG